jgi:hypothetical protein
MGERGFLFNPIELSQRALTSPPVERLIALPPSAIMIVYKQARRVVAETTEIIFQTTPQVELARGLAGDHEIAKAEQVLENIQLGEEAGISEIVFSGRKELAEIVIESDEAKTVPAEVTDQIVDMAEQVEVSLEFEPYLEDPVQEKFRDAVKKHSAKARRAREVVRDIFDYRQNEL